MNQVFVDIYNKIKEYDKIIIHRHIRPDGDCIGAQQGLLEIIKTTFPNKTVIGAGLNDIPDYLESYVDQQILTEADYQGALAIIVDTSVDNRVASDLFKHADYRIKIDHHDDSPDFGDINYVDAEAPSCCSILVSMFREWEGAKISKRGADSLYLGIISDTGRFRYRGVNEVVFSNAAYLVELGADIQTIYDKMYIDKLETLKLNGYVLTHFKSTPNGVVYIYFTKKMMQKFNVSREDASNLVNSLSTIKGSLIWVAFIDQMKAKDPNCKNKAERPDKEIRCRIRSRRVAINDIAANYRGGGHLQAAGATIYSKKEMKNLLIELDNKLKQFKEENPDVE